MAAKVGKKASGKWGMASGMTLKNQESSLTSRHSQLASSHFLLATGQFVYIPPKKYI